MQSGEYYMVALIRGRRGGISRRQVLAFLQPPLWRHLSQILIVVQPYSRPDGVCPQWRDGGAQFPWGGPRTRLLFLILF
jgi:hypothetical protein